MLHFQLVTLTGIKFDDEISEVLIPTLDGQIGVLTDHMPLVSVVANGVISIRKLASDPDYKMDHYATYGGVMDVTDNLLRILADEADGADDINEAEANKAYELAVKMKVEAKDELSLENAQKLLDRQAVRLQVASLRRTHRNK